jgi:hypothetical protein
MQRNAQTLERQMRAADGLAGLKAEVEVERLKAELDTMQLDVQSYEAGLAAATKELNQVQLHLQVAILHEACASNRTQSDVSMTFKRAHNTVQKRLRDTPPF